ncbi:DUF6479 family protein [Streptomyces sp. SCSIO ZS0520]|uniref:DUF6479 family protein n=1 Tax=Streptomyces sp. SCSIO ZS0520 TaxID=2892996 RepID=UPI0021DB1857|nr:DUF6479 family protein [Streptomyces sp. SCSIO ZS0520]
MNSNSNTVLAASTGTSMFLIVIGIVVVLGLIGAFLAGRRRVASRRAASTPAGTGTQPARGETQRGDTWQTPGDDPDQGHPHP